MITSSFLTAADPFIEGHEVILWPQQLLEHPYWYRGIFDMVEVSTISYVPSVISLS
jgi:hypothetical protein